MLSKYPTVVGLTCLGLPGLLRVPFDLQLAHQTCGRSMLGVTHENLAYQYRLPFVDDQLAILDVLAQGRHAAPPHPLGLAGGHLVAAELAGDPPFEPGKRQKDVARTASHCRRGDRKMLG